MENAVVLPYVMWPAARFEDVVIDRGVRHSEGLVVCEASRTRCQEVSKHEKGITLSTQPMNRPGWMHKKLRVLA